MGVELMLWRVRVGLFNSVSVCITGSSSSSRLDSFLLALFKSFSWPTIILIIGCLCLVGALTYFPIQCFLMTLLVLVVLYRLVLLISILCTVFISINCNKCRFAPCCVLRLPLIFALILLFTPGLIHVIDLSLRPNIAQILLLLANDVEKNPGPSQSLNILYCNVNSLMAEGGQRLSDLSLRLKSDNIHIACLCESGRNLVDDVIKIDGYCNSKPGHSLYESSGRGLLVYIHESLIFSRCHDLETSEGSSLWIKVTSNHKSVLRGLVYRSPSQNPSQRNIFYSELDESLNKASQVHADATILGGISMLEASSGGTKTSTWLRVLASMTYP